MKSVIVITGKKNSGKTTTALKIKEHFPSTKGFISLSADAKDEITLLDLGSGDRLPLMSRYFESDADVGAYRYLQSTFDYASNVEFDDKGVVIVDEIGRLELRGEGFDFLMRHLLSLSVNLIITVRTEFLEDVVRHYEIEADCFSPGNLDEILRKIKNLNPDWN